MESVTVSEQDMSISVVDKRKQLTKPIQYVCTALNALSAIEGILLSAYSYTFDSTFYDLTAWEAARGLVENVTINMQKPDSVINVIEGICGSVFGLFRVNTSGLFTFRVVDTADSITDMIPAGDILGEHSVSYNPTEVVSSVRVGYGRDWATTGNQYTYYEDTSREASVFTQYKTYQQREFNTWLPTLSAATAFGTRVLSYVDTVRGAESITVPLEYYAVNIGDQVGVITQRGGQSMLGERKAEVVSIEYALDTPTMRLGIRHGGEIEALRTTEVGAVRITESGAARMVE